MARQEKQDQMQDKIGGRSGTEEGNGRQDRAMGEMSKAEDQAKAATQQAREKAKQQFG